MRFFTFCLLIAAFLVLSGCSPAVPSLTHKATSPTSIVPTNKTITPAVSVQPIVRGPEILPLRIKPTLSSTGLNINIQVVILNPNPGKLEIGDINLSKVNAGGSNDALAIFPGGIVEAASNRTFSFDIELPRNLLTENALTLEVDTKTVNTAAALPLKSNAQINVRDILSRLIVYPKITLQASITNIINNGTQTLVVAQLEGSINNPNPLDLIAMTMQILIKDKNNVQVQYANIETGSIPANSDHTFKSTLLLPVEVLNQTELTAYAHTNTQFFNNIQSISNTKTISIPKLENLISVPQLTIHADSAWNSDNTIYIVDIKSTIQNDNEFVLSTEDFQTNLYNNSTNTLINSDKMLSGIIQGIPRSSTRSVIIRFDYLKQDLRRGFEALITGDTKIGLDGVSEKIPLSAKIVYKLTP